MIVNNLGKTFGPVGSFSGIIVFILGSVATFFSIASSILILIGALVGFTSEQAIIDPENKRVKYSNTLFGFIRTGKWINLSSDMKIGLNISKQNWTAYSQGNRSIDIDEKNLLITLYSANKRKIMPLKRIKSMDLAIEEIKSLKSLLDLNSKD